MTFGALAFFGATCELAAVGIGLVAIDALGKGDRLFEITGGVARDARDRGVLTEQRIFCFGVIEGKVLSNFFPAGGGVAVLARFLELTPMRIEMARGAGAKFHVLEARGAARCIGLVTFFAGDFDVHAGKRIAGFGVIEVFCCLPILGVMAGGAILAELTLVVVLVAGDAFLRQAHVGLRQIFTL